MMAARCFLLPMLLFATAVSAFAETAVAGRIKSTSGAVFIVRKGAQIPATPGAPLMEADGIRTGADGRVGITLKDETRLSLGPDSEIRLEQFVYSPGEGRLQFALRIARGLVAYVSGRIAKLSPDAVRLETPSAILGVRGTHLVVRVEGS